MGAIFTQQESGTVPLYRFTQSQFPWEHAYNTDATAPAGYTFNWAIGYVWPKEAL